MGPGLTIRSRPITVDPELRKENIRRYRRERYGEAAPDYRIDPRIVVVHWTAGPSAASAQETFRGEILKGRADIAGAGDLNTGAHFLVDKDGSIAQLLPVDWMARHTIGLNHAAIGIENVGGVDDKDDLTEAQLRGDAALIRELKRRWPKLEFMIGHYEYRRFEGHPLWKERDGGYRTEKSDPGERFMRELRAALSDLGLKGAP